MTPKNFIFFPAHLAPFWRYLAMLIVMRWGIEPSFGCWN